MPINVCDHFYRSFSRQVVPEANKRRVAVLGMKSLGGGQPGRLVTAKVCTAEQALRFALSQPTASLITGIDSMAVLEQNIAIARSFKPLGGDKLEALLTKVKPMAMSVQFNIPSTVIIGAGASAELASQLRRLEIDRILLVTDPGMVQLGVVERIVAPLKDAKIEVAVFPDVQPDPTDRNVRDGLETFRSCAAQGIVALGGGSAIDCAKAIVILTANPLPLSRYMGYHKVPRPGVPLIAIPTTAGTGSEVTKVAVITDTDHDVKMMILDVHLLPRVALVDYQLTMTMPRPLTAAVGVDTLTHAIEAYVSRKANPMTDPLALSCVGLVARHLRTAFREPGNEPARAGMMLAACQGGIAFANSSVCLVHGMSRPVGALFHVPHGLSNAVLLPAVTRFSVGSAPERYATVARVFGCASEKDGDDCAAESLIGALESLNRDLDIPRLRHCKGVDADRFERSLEKMARDALSSGSPQNNPRVPTLNEIVGLYREAW